MATFWEEGRMAREGVGEGTGQKGIYSKVYSPCRSYDLKIYSMTKKILQAWLGPYCSRKTQAF